MKPAPVDSSMIHDVGYDPETETLEVGFSTGTVYQCFDVEQEAFDALISASSKGRYFLDNVEPSYGYVQVRQTWRR